MNECAVLETMILRGRSLSSRRMTFGHSANFSLLLMGILQVQCDLGSDICERAEENKCPVNSQQWFYQTTECLKFLKSNHCS